MFEEEVQIPTVESPDASESEEEEIEEPEEIQEIITYRELVSPLSSKQISIFFEDEVR